ncbi:hypothetical protein [Prevotella sp. oral taxon 317]|uniref:hypothetical protein n=1 Tax=Prevotella sp. oral taxon 317 TaxID=652721 RepID=UPI0005C6604A|nr:hypothetical protein [Prevotella sp. oral taxon 317]
MKYIIVFCVMLSMLSCKKNSIEMTIAGRNHRYWLKKSHAEKSQVYYYFDRQGRWYVYERAYKANVLTKYDGGDIMLIEKWSLINDTTINIGGMEYCIRECNDTLLVIESSMFTDTLMSLDLYPSVIPERP